MYRPPINDDELNLLRQARLSMWLKAETSSGAEKILFRLAYRELDRAAKYELSRRRWFIWALLVWLCSKLGCKIVVMPH